MNKKTFVVATALVKFKDKFLIAKRASTKKFGPNKWGFISGFIDTKECAEEIILRELTEETGLKGKIMKSGKVFELSENDGRWVVLPFLIETENKNFTLNHDDHSEIKWVNYAELDSYPDLTELEEFRKQNLFVC